jgi:hypothetical protein
VRQHCAALAGAALIWAAAAAPASAQVIETRPFPGLFGSGDPAKSVTQVDFQSFVAGGYETSTSSLGDGAFGSSTGETTFGNIVYRGRVAHKGRRTNFGADAGATTSYYDTTGEMSPFNLSAGAFLNGTMGRHASFALRQTVSYSPYFAFTTVTSDVPAEAEFDPVADADSSVDPHVDQRVLRLSTKSYSSSANLSRRVGREGSLFASYGLTYTDYARGAFDALGQFPRAGYRRKLSRFGSFVASYGLQTYEYRNSGYPRLTSHNVSVGLGYDRPLSIWRRTTVGFNVSTALVGNGTTTSAHVNGTARLHRRFGRTWIAGVTYLRGQQVLEGFAIPFFTFSDSVAATFAGRLPHDIALSGRLSYSHSRFSIAELDNTSNTLGGSARIQVPVMWALAVYVESYFSDYDFQRRLGLLEGIPLSLDRVGVRAGLTVSVPVYR